jgi:hypothetical protein
MANTVAFIPHTDPTYKVIGCAMRAHNRLGAGLNEVTISRLQAGRGICGRRLVDNGWGNGLADG